MRGLGDKAIIGAILLLFALNVMVDSVLYFVSVAIDGLTLGVAVWLGYKLISHYNGRLREKDNEIKQLSEQLKVVQSAQSAKVKAFSR